MELKTLRLDELHPYKRNPRKNDDAVDAVAESIRQCGYVSPIVVDENYEILAGHTRYKALKKLHRSEAKVLVCDNLSEEQKRKYRLLDNKTNELAEWDMDLLLGELAGLDFEGLDLDWGFDDDEPVEHGDVAVHESISVVIECSDDEEAERVYNALREEGYECRISTL